MAELSSERRAAALAAFDRLLTIMEELRVKCPWDRKQTIESIRHLTIEETYELSDAILSGDLDEVRKELGDLALHLVFYAKIASEQQAFDMGDVLTGICEKLIRRHPHVYGDTEANDARTVEQNWEQIKLREAGETRKSALSGVPSSLPALLKAFRMQEKARGVGFDWDRKDQVWDKVQEELLEFRDAEVLGDVSQMEEEFGDLLFALINYARFSGINPEEALERTNRKFLHRFQHIEQRAYEQDKNVKDMSLDEMEEYWNEAKKTPPPE
uniref:Nucleoside triphosphate pyrophosphohydrolase n=1 Tax=Roseihalotalea indica TaxID=2867963 RepID=A0AA49JJ97_9BACT|nr:nucleoside triphosphate pyrophosphohydrolase [Tunicatimonas sp. TK19036]